MLCCEALYSLRDRSLQVLAENSNLTTFPFEYVFSSHDLQKNQCHYCQEVKHHSRFSLGMVPQGRFLEMGWRAMWVCDSPACNIHRHSLYEQYRRRRQISTRPLCLLCARLCPKIRLESLPARKFVCPRCTTNIPDFPLVEIEVCSWTCATKNIWEKLDFQNRMYKGSIFCPECALHLKIDINFRLMPLWYD